MLTEVLPAAAGVHVIHYTLDDEPQTTTLKLMTPVQIMSSAKPKPIDPDTHYLIQLEGQHQVSYKDKPNDEIHMHEHAKFITVETGPTPVS
jgi:hypothetical protein